MLDRVRGKGDFHTVFIQCPEIFFFYVELFKGKGIFVSQRCVAHGTVVGVDCCKQSKIQKRMEWIRDQFSRCFCLEIRGWTKLKTDVCVATGFQQSRIFDGCNAMSDPACSILEGARNISGTATFAGMNCDRHLQPSCFFKQGFEFLVWMSGFITGKV